MKLTLVFCPNKDCIHILHGVCECLAIKLQTNYPYGLNCSSYKTEKQVYHAGLCFATGKLARDLQGAED